jgi:GNAT superfamily N-acetyltransferase
VDIDERRRLADENVAAAFTLAQERSREPRGGIARFGAVQVVAVGVDIAFFNPVLAIDPASTPEDVRAGIAWVESRELPVCVQVREDLDPAIRTAVEELGLVADPSPTPVMALEPIPAAATVSSPPDGVEIRTGGRELLEDWHEAIESGAAFRRLFGPSLGADPSVRLAVAYLDSVPVAGAAAIASGSTVGVYSVGTVERARRQGIGRAVTWAAIRAGQAAWGSTIAILQSSEMGRPVYRSMGFDELSRYIEFERPKG